MLCGVAYTDDTRIGQLRAVDTRTVSTSWVSCHHDRAMGQKEYYLHTYKKNYKCVMNTNTKLP